MAYLRCLYCSNTYWAATDSTDKAHRCRPERMWKALAFVVKALNASGVDGVAEQYLDDAVKQLDIE